MATRERMMDALRQAHAAGDTDNATKIADMIHRHDANTASQATPTEPQAIIEEPSSLERKAGVLGRGIIEGVAGIPDTLYNTASLAGQGVNFVKEKIGMTPNKPWFDLPESIAITEPYGTALADKLGLQKATDDDSIIYPSAKVLGGFAIPAAGLSALGKAGTAAKIGAAAGSLGKQVPGILAGQAAGDIARQSGAGEGAQLAANIAGSMAMGIPQSVIAGAVRGAGRGAKLALTPEKALEAVAGRTLNRAAGKDSQLIAEYLAAGKVPTIASQLTGYAPTTSQVAGNSGISTILRQTQLYPDNLAPIQAREFSNIKAISDFAEKAGASKKLIDKVSERSKARAIKIAAPMRDRNLPVNIANVKAELDSKILRHEGNRDITDALLLAKSELPAGDSAGFNWILNYKQGLDETLRSNPMASPKVASMQKAASALQGVKSELINSLTDTEPGFRKYVTTQAKEMAYLKKKEAANKILESTRLTTPRVGYTDLGQEEIMPLAGGKLAAALRRDSSADLAPKQQATLSTARDYANLGSRANLGTPANSATAQNLNVQQAVYNDLLSAGLGEKPNALGKIGARLMGGTLGAFKGITNDVRTGYADDLSKVLTRTELDPAYAAKLMKQHGLGQLNFSEPAKQAILRSMLTAQANRNNN